ncbi:MAG: glycine cleavage T C-terminal barrel domain-containing protein [Pseudomonadota bacterium]
MIFPADDILIDRPKPTPLYAACAAMSEANVWTSINGYAAARLYSSLEGEYRAAKEGAAMADFGPLSRYAVRGENAALLLSRVATAPAATLSPGESARGLILDDDGGVMDFAEVARLTDDLFLLTTPSPQARRVQLAARGLDAKVETISRVVAAIGVLGPSSGDALMASGMKLPGDHVAASAVMRGVETAARPVQFGAVPGIELIFPAEDALTIWERLTRRAKVKPIGVDAMEILRIESGAPRPGADFRNSASRLDAARASPEEIGLPHLAPLDSGWFTGRRALRFAPPPPRDRLIALSVDADRVLPGAAVFDGGRAIGRITTAAWSPAARRVLAFASIQAASYGKTRELTVSGESSATLPARPLETPENELAKTFLESRDAATEKTRPRVS